MPLDSLQNGRYQTVRELGSGSMGEVFLVQDTVIGRQVAIKTMRADPAAYPDTESIKDAVKLFKREAQAIARLEHPNILPLFDFGEEKREKTVFTYMVMPYCQEGSLSDWLKQHRSGKPLSIDEVLYFVEQAAEALQYSHEHGVIHQDVKPSNFLLRTHGSGQLLPGLLLADFGIARVSSGTTITTVTTIGAGPRGTPRYMPPEQWEGKPVPASDQYALAVTTYQLLTQRYPFAGDQMLQLMYQHLQNAPLPPGKWNPAVEPAVDAVILRALAKKPAERFPSVRDFADALRQAAQKALPAESAQPARESGPSTLESMPTEEAPYNTFMPTVPPQEYPRPQTPQPRSNPGPVRQPQQPFVLPANSSLAAPASLTRFDSPARPAQQPVVPAPKTPVVPSPFSWAPGPQFAPAPRPVPQKASSGGKGVFLISLVLLIVLAGAGGAYYYFVLKGNQTNPRVYNPTPDPNVHKQPTVSPHANPYTGTMPTLSFTDPLSQPNMWQSVQNNQLTNGYCLFEQGTYHASSNVPGSYTLCPASARQPSTSDMTFEVQMQIVHGACGGVLFRGDFQQGNFYYFDVCYDGLHYLTTYAGFKLLQKLPVQGAALTALQKDAQATITIGIVAQGTALTFFLNGQQVDQLTDSTYTSGQIALFCFDINDPTEVIFSNARLWTA
ncbi:MAG TPA: protein kinase [Ktedonobacteraceae bacterium]